MILIDDSLDLKEPWMLAAFEGWNDAAESATGLIDHLIDEWEADLIAEVDPEDYYDFQVNRPDIVADEHGDRVVVWPTTRVYLARPSGFNQDILLVRGIEPNMRWQQFCDELMEVVKSLGVELVVTLGALLADTPHTRPVPVSTTTRAEPLIEQLGIEPSTYEGPTGINGIFDDACYQAKIYAASLWAAVPHYVGQPPCPKVSLALLGGLEELFQRSLPMGDLTELSKAWERGVNELASEDTEIGEYVESLEAARDTSELPQASGDAIAREFERYLKRRSGDAE